MSPFSSPMSRLEENLQEHAAQLLSKLSDVIVAVDDLRSAVEVLDGHVGAATVLLAEISVKLGGGLPSALHNDRLKVTGGLL